MKHCGAAYAVAMVAATVAACFAMGYAVAAHLYDRLRPG